MRGAVRHRHDMILPLPLLLGGAHAVDITLLVAVLVGRYLGVPKGRVGWMEVEANRRGSKHLAVRLLTSAGSLLTPCFDAQLSRRSGQGRPSRWHLKNHTPLPFHVSGFVSLLVSRSTPESARRLFHSTRMRRAPCWRTGASPALCEFVFPGQIGTSNFPCVFWCMVDIKGSALFGIPHNLHKNNSSPSYLVAVNQSVCCIQWA